MIDDGCHDAEVRGRWCSRAGRAVATTVVAVALLSGCGASEPEPSRPLLPLRIMLVNDDGWNAPGIVALRDGLRRAGHRVVEVAPTGDRGSTGTATTTRGEITLSRPTRDPDVWAVSGTAADTALVGLSAVMGREQPDLVVSGINPQPTVGIGAMYSGTAGAALTAAGFRFPSMAVSTSVLDPARPRPEEFARTVDFTVRLVAQIQRQRPEGGRLLPERTILNVNYPGGPSPARSVEAAKTSDNILDTVVFRRGPRPGTLVPVPAHEYKPAESDDAVQLRNGRAVLTDLSVDPDRSAPPPRAAAILAPAISP